MSDPRRAPLDAAENCEETGEPTRGRLLRLAACCPRCGARPAFRVTEPAARAIAAQLPGERIATYQCQRRQCGAIYDLVAEAFRKAS